MSSPLLGRRPPRQLALFVGVLLGTLLLGAVVAERTLSYFREAAEEERELSATAVIVSEQTAAAFAALEAGLRHAAREYVAWTAGQERSVPAAQALLGGIQKGLPFLNALSWFDATGERVASSLPGPLPRLNLARTEQFQFHRASPATVMLVSPPVQALTSAEFVATVSVPVPGPGGEFLGVVAGRLDLDYFDRLFERLVADSGRVLALVHTSGRFMARAPISDATRRQSVTDRPEWPRILSSSAPVVVHTTNLFNGEALVVAARRVGAFPLVVTANEPWSIVLARWRTGTRAVATVTVVGMLLVGGLTHLLHRALRRQDEESAARQRAQQQLAANEARLRAIVESNPDSITVADADGRLLDVNPAGLSMLGVTSADQVLGTSPLDRVDPKDRPRLRQSVEAVFRGERTEQTFELLAADGTRRWVEQQAVPLWDLAEPPRVRAMLALSRDVTERRQGEAERDRLQGQLLQAQKLESVGRLAGGVAHDFNNMLGVILGHAELGLSLVAPPDPLHASLEAILQASQRSASLTRQLLTFASRQPVAPKLLDLNDVVAGLLKMLRRLIGEDIDLAWMPGAKLWPVKADPTQIDQVLANLAVNARDAIAGVGTITVETRNLMVDEAYRAAHVGAAPGAYVVLAVSDTGCGMDREVLDHVFEPFFTTKGVGQGTGLGLATVYGIVKQHQGFVNVQSEPGKGTTLEVCLPRAPGEVPETAAPRVTQATPGHGETVLLVEDEAAVLASVAGILRRLGYVVLTAGTTAEAIRLAETHAGEIRLLVTDVVMPEMNGRELAERVRTISPGLACLFMSGYTAGLMTQRGVLEEGVHFIQKPFSMVDLAAKVHEALERP